MAVEMHRVGQGKEDALAFGVILSGAVNTHDQVDPVLSRIVFGNKAVFGRVVIFVAQVVDQRIGQVEPHGCGSHVPTREVAVRNGIVLVGPFEADLKVVASQLVNCSNFKSVADAEVARNAAAMGRLAIVDWITHVHRNDGYQALVWLIGTCFVKLIGCCSR